MAAGRPPAGRSRAAAPQLTRHFGLLGAATTQRVQSASPAELEQWADSILDAHTLDEVLRTR